MTASSLTDTQGILSLAAIALAFLAVAVCLVQTRAIGKLRATQRVVLGDGAQRDLIAQGASLQQAFEALQDYVGDVTARLDGRLDGVEVALAGTISRRALVRYDAYNELSGQQSMSIALLDEHRCGIVLTCIHHRDQARLYAKQVRDGQGELELSPEEAEAVRVAISSDPAALEVNGSSPAAPGGEVRADGS
jgi:hypothetical protein